MGLEPAGFIRRPASRATRVAPRGRVKGLKGSGQGSEDGHRVRAGVRGAGRPRGAGGRGQPDCLRCGLCKAQAILVLGSSCLWPDHIPGPGAARPPAPEPLSRAWPVRVRLLNLGTAGRLGTGLGGGADLGLGGLGSPSHPRGPGSRTPSSNLCCSLLLGGARPGAPLSPSLVSLPSAPSPLSLRQSGHPEARITPAQLPRASNPLHAPGIPSCSPRLGRHRLGQQRLE